ncbi:MAG: universal stress protein [Myxococcota bacterium]
MSESWKLIVGLDFSECGKRALRQALAMASGKNAELHIVHAVTDADLGKGEKIERQSAALAELPGMIWQIVFGVLDELDLSHEDVPVQLHVRLGPPADTIRQVAVDYDGDLVVVGTHAKKGLEKLVLGSVAQSLVNDAVVPVLVAHKNRLSTLEKTVMPDEARPPGEEVERKPIASRHVYRSTLIDAWGAFGRPTTPGV